MSGIAGLFNTDFNPIADIKSKLKAMNRLQEHRGPDGEGLWIHNIGMAGFAHRRLSVIDLDKGDQPMSDDGGNLICFNGEIYNYLELRQEIGGQYKTASDTEVLLKAYRKWGRDCVLRLKGMFAFVIWDEKEQMLFCARDRIGIKPFNYYFKNNLFAFASEIKALLPVIKSVEVNTEGLKDYITFQYCLDGKTLFSDIDECPPAHTLTIKNGKLSLERYWQLYYDIDWDHSEKYFIEKLDAIISESVQNHLLSDVPIGGYVSGGVDSSLISALASKQCSGDYIGFIGKFTDYTGYDESMYAQSLADMYGFELLQMEITLNDFLNHIEKVIYHLDQPVAGPGSFCQYMISSLAAKHRKVVLGGQGGDEIFGGYTRYLIAYFEQCIKGAIDGTMNSGNFVVTYESIIPNLIELQNYKPMLKSFWKEGLFESIDKRYYRLVNRAPDISGCIRWDKLGHYEPFEKFNEVFNSKNAKKASYFVKMLHYDFKTSLPALLQLEDKMGMAHGLESRVPFLDHNLIEFVASIPASFKLKNGRSKHILKESMGQYLPQDIVKRKDKMGFPVPFVEWMKGPAREFIGDILSSKKAQEREYIDNKSALSKIQDESEFGRNMWGLLSLELWYQQFIDNADKFKAMIKD